MNIAVILAGGSGTRTNHSVPKQFLTVNDIPIIVYTMLNLQKSPDIDRIVVLCPDGWINFVSLYAEQHHITKLMKVLVGGSTRHQTILNAIEYLCGDFSGDDIVGIFDANRPLIPHNVIHNIMMAAETENAVVAVEPCYDSMYEVNDNKKICCHLDRDVIFKGQTPETAKLGNFKKIYQKAAEDHIEEPPTALFLRYEGTACAVEGSSKNFKITTADDLAIFKALIAVEKK